MKHASQHNKMIRAKSDLESLYSVARICGMTSQDMNSRFQQIIADMGKIPEYRKAYLRGIRDEKNNQLYMESLVYGGFYNGRFYSTHSNRPDYYGKHGIEPSQWAMDCHDGVIRTGHYWATTKEPKPYFVSESDE